MHWDSRTGPVDEGLFAGLVLLPHHDIQLLPPALIELAEARITVAIRIRVPIFLPKQLQGYVAMRPELLVHRGKIR